MAALTDILARVRMDIGDPSQPFRSTEPGDGQTVLFDLPKQELNEGSLEATIVNGATQTTLTDQTAAQPWNISAAYASGTVVTFQTGFYSASQASSGQQPAPDGTTYWSDVTATAFTVNAALGKVMLAAPVALNALLIISGTAWALFSDLDLYQIIVESINQHTYAQEFEERYRDIHGFYDYRETPKMLLNLPAIEEPLVVMLSVINVFWTLASDAATDSNVQTAEGTAIDRTARYRQLMQQISALTARYMDYCAQLNVGLYRWETLQLRRTSKTTGRLVPLFKPQELDDHRWPTRLIPPIDHRNDDNSGLPTPLWNGSWGV